MRIQAIRGLLSGRYVPEEQWRADVVPVLWKVATDLNEPARVRAASLDALRRHPLSLAEVEGPFLLSMLSDSILAPHARSALVAKLQPEVLDLPQFGKPPKARTGTHATFLRRAIDLAVENVESGRGGPFGAVIVQEGKIVAEGVNLVTAANEPTAHAEITAIRAACEYQNRVHLTGCIVYSSCEPCPMCLGAIHWARIDKLYFASTREDAAAAGFDDSFIYDQVPVKPAQRSIPARRMLARQGVEPLRAWMTDQQKVEY